MPLKREYYIQLNRVPGMGSTRMHQLLNALGGDIERLCQATTKQLQDLGLNTQLAERIFSTCRDSQALAQELACAQRQGVTLITWQDDSYPPALRTIPDPPLVLYVRGALAPDEVAVAIVGSRQASPYGQQAAQQLSYDLALRGITVISGLARGIDACAHRGALKASGRTVAVLGSGLNHIYPPEHEALAHQITEQGALISEYPMDSSPIPHHFPRRNRIISGLALGVVVVEARSRSGALITADCALEQGREVFAVPGPITAITSQGTHALLKQGARLVSSIEDILEELRLTTVSPKTVLGSGIGAQWKDAEGSGLRVAGNCPEPRAASPERSSNKPTAQGPQLIASEMCRAEDLSNQEQQLLACLNTLEPIDIDTLALSSGLQMPQLSPVLLDLQMKRLIQQLPGKRFLRWKTPSPTTR